MAIVNGIALESNKNLRINFKGGTLSSDSGLLLIKKFYHKIGMDVLAKAVFRTAESCRTRLHKDLENEDYGLVSSTGPDTGKHDSS